jgi:hypothetical protein
MLVFSELERSRMARPSPLCRGASDRSEGAVAAVASVALTSCWRHRGAEREGSCDGFGEGGGFVWAHALVEHLLDGPAKGHPATAVLIVGGRYLNVYALTPTQANRSSRRTIL